MYESERRFLLRKTSASTLSHFKQLLKLFTINPLLEKIRSAGVDVAGILIISTLLAILARLG